MIIALDFDGTLHTGQWPGIGAPAPYAQECVNKLKQDGHYIIIWTCREGQRLTEAVNWLLEKNIPFDRVNDHRPGVVEKYGSPARKVYAHVYVDDKQIGGLPTWPEIYSYISEKEQQYTHPTSGV